MADHPPCSTHIAREAGPAAHRCPCGTTNGPDSPIIVEGCVLESLAILDGAHVEVEDTIVLDRLTVGKSQSGDKGDLSGLTAIFRGSRLPAPLPFPDVMRGEDRSLDNETGSGSSYDPLAILRPEAGLAVALWGSDAKPAAALRPGGRFGSASSSGGRSSPSRSPSPTPRRSSRSGSSPIAFASDSGGARPPL